MRLDIAVAMSRHATQAKADAFVKQVRDSLCSSGAASVAAGSSDDTGEGFRGCVSMQAFHRDGSDGLQGYGMGSGRGYAARHAGKGNGNHCTSNASTRRCEGGSLSPPDAFSL